MIGNLKGEGLIMGGLMIISKKGIHYSFLETEFGTHAPLAGTYRARVFHIVKSGHVSSV